MWSLHVTVTPPKHKFGIYSIEAKAHNKGKIETGLKPARAVRPIPVDNVSRIANRVDSMSIDNQPKDENKNTEVLSSKVNIFKYLFSRFLKMIAKFLILTW